MTTKQIATKQISTKVLQIAVQNAGRLDCRLIARYLGVSADELNAALDLLGDKIIRVRGVGQCIQLA